MATTNGNSVKSLLWSGGAVVVAVAVSVFLHEELKGTHEKDMEHFRDECNRDRTEVNQRLEVLSLDVKEILQRLPPR